MQVGARIMQEQVKPGTAYLLWCLWLFGLGGMQRLYTGNIATGLLYLFTWGLFGLGQLVDLALIPGMVNQRNRSLRGLQVGGTSDPMHQITLIEDVPQANQLLVPQPAPEAPMKPMQRLLKVAKDNGGTLSLAQAALYTNLESDQLKQLLQEAVRVGYAEINNDPETGAIRYHFDL